MNSMTWQKAPTREKTDETSTIKLTHHTDFGWIRNRISEEYEWFEEVLGKIKGYDCFYKPPSRAEFSKEADLFLKKCPWKDKKEKDTAPLRGFQINYIDGVEYSLIYGAGRYCSKIFSKNFYPNERAARISPEDKSEIIVRQLVEDVRVQYYNYLNQYERRLLKLKELRMSS